MDLYADQILEHSKHPHHVGSIADATATHEEANPSCGDTVRLELRIENNTLADLGWTGGGCAISQAGMSLLSDHVMGRTVEDILHFKKPDMLELVGVPVSARRMKCALLGLHALQNTLRVHLAMPPQSWTETVADPPMA